MDEQKEKLTDLELLRLGAAGKPRQVEIVRRIKGIIGRSVSKGHVSNFESGAVQVSDDFLKAYAKALGVSAKEVERRYWTTRLAYSKRLSREARRRLESIPA